MEHISAILANCWWMILLSALIAYLLGSINTAVLVTGIVTKGKKDIRQMGSGNAGFTNVLRSVGKVPAIITIVCRTEVYYRRAYRRFHLLVCIGCISG